MVPRTAIWDTVSLQGRQLHPRSRQSLCDPQRDRRPLYGQGGDADGDGKVWLSDWGNLRQNFSNTGSGFGWIDADFDGDGKVWLGDWGLLRQRFANADYTVPKGDAVALRGPALTPFPSPVHGRCCSAVSWVCWSTPG